MLKGELYSVIDKFQKIVWFCYLKHQSLDIISVNENERIIFQINHLTLMYMFSITKIYPLSNSCEKFLSISRQLFWCLIIIPVVFLMLGFPANLAYTDNIHFFAINGDNRIMNKRKSLNIIGSNPLQDRKLPFQICK